MTNTPFSCFIDRYKPVSVEFMSIEPHHQRMLNITRDKCPVRLLVGAPNCRGKSSIIDSITASIGRSHDKFEIISYDGNKDVSSNFYTDILHIFCIKSTSATKIVLVDNIDNIKSENQLMLTKYMHLHPKVSFIMTSNECYKIDVGLFSRMQLIEIKPYTTDQLLGIVDRITDDNQMTVTREDKIRVIELSDHNTRIIINRFEYMYHVRDAGGLVSRRSIDTICGVDDHRTFDRYTNAVIRGDLGEAISVICEFINSGKSVIDILKAFFDYIVYTDTIAESYKDIFVGVTGRYYSYFYTINESSFELDLMTDELINLYRTRCVKSS